MEDRYITIKRGNAVLVIDRVGGQLVSYKINGVEIMYQGALEKGHAWSATAKNLFPNPGPVGQKGAENQERIIVKNGKEVKQTIYTHNSGIYGMEQHGFAQYKLFDVQGHARWQCLLTLSADEDTINDYPYDFRYHVGYEINADGSLVYESHVNNTDNKPILAGMGWHPGFQLHKEPARYYVVFEDLEGEDDCNVEPGKHYAVQDVIDEGHATTFFGIKSANVKLVYVDENGNEMTYLEMHTESPVFLLWGKDDHMICLEPWNTTPRQISKLTTQDKTEQLAEDGAKIVQPGEVDTLSCTIAVNPLYLEKISALEMEREL